jgi:REP element-mobilizing transposase RayT
MANTYSKLLVHLIFVVKYRQSLIAKDWKDELCKYASGIITNKHHKLIAINCMPDHMLLLLSYNPDTRLPDIVRDLKSNTSRFINESKKCRTRFLWQSGYAAFSVGHSQLSMVARYIENQELHHKKKAFRKEYRELLTKNEIEFEEKYLFVEPS